METWIDQLNEAVRTHSRETIEALLTKESIATFKQEAPKLFNASLMAALQTLIDAGVTQKAMMPYFEYALAVLKPDAEGFSFLMYYCEYLYDRKAYRTLFETLDAYLENSPIDALFQLQLLLEKGSYLERLDHTERAIATFLELLRHFDAVQDKNNIPLLKTVFLANYHLGTCYQTVFKYTEAERYLNDATRLVHKLNQHKQLTEHAFLMLVYAQLTNASDRKNIPKTRQIYIEFAPQFKKAVRKNPSDYLVYYGIMCGKMAATYVETDTKQALTYYHEAIKAIEKLAKVDNTELPLLIGWYYLSTAALYKKELKSKPALRFYEKALGVFTMHQANRPDIQAEVAEILIELTELYVENQDFNQAHASFEQSRALYKTLGKTSGKYRTRYAQVSYGLACFLEDRHQLESAYDIMHEVMMFYSQNFTADHGAYAQKAVESIMAYIRIGKKHHPDHNQSSLYETALLACRLLHQYNPAKYHDTMIVLFHEYAHHLAEQGERMQAETYYQKALTKIEGSFRQNPKDYQERMAQILTDYETDQMLDQEEAIVKLEHTWIRFYETVMTYDLSVRDVYVKRVFSLVRRLQRNQAYQVAQKYLNRLWRNQKGPLTADEKLTCFHLAIVSACHHEKPDKINLRLEQLFAHWESMHNPTDTAKVMLIDTVDILKKHAIALSTENRTWYTSFIQSG